MILWPKLNFQLFFVVTWNFWCPEIPLRKLTTVSPYKNCISLTSFSNTVYSELPWSCVVQCRLGVAERSLKTLKRCLPLWSWRPTRWRTTRQPSGRNGWLPPRWCGSRPRTQKNPPQMTNWGLSVSATLTAWRHTCPRGFRTETFLYTPGTLHGVAISQRLDFFPYSFLCCLGCITACSQ